MSKTIANVWIFQSSSGSGTYETLKYDDDSTSCNCPGWTRRVAPDGSRSCKHTRLVDMGRADAVCVSTKAYNEPTVSAPKKPVVVEKKTTKSEAIARKIQWK